MSFISVYQDALRHKGYHTDVVQAKVVEQLDRLFRDLLDQKIVKGRMQRLLRLAGWQNKGRHLYGCYLWGGVGRGKTWLMDLFFGSIPVTDKSRFHFHEFMQYVHQQLNRLQGKPDPLHLVASDIARSARLICLDEFHVSDITDAMLLYGLLDALYRQGVVLVMTSNVTPDELYKNGLQRSLFLPAIELIKNQNRIIFVDGETDYRQDNTGSGENYYCPLAPDTDKLLERQFMALATGAVKQDQHITIQDRPIQTRLLADNIVWFDFNALCDGPRAASDYLQLAMNYEFVVISNIYKMLDINDDVAKRFINMVDAFYDRGVGLIISATGWPQDLYIGRRFQEEFRRTASRLEELRSRKLLQQYRQQNSIDRRVVSR